MSKTDKKHLKKRGGRYYLNAPGRGPGGKDLVKSLKTGSLEIAIARRDVMLSEAKGDAWAEVEKLAAAKSRGWASLGDLIRGYYAWAHEARALGKAPKPSTIRQNAHALLRVVRSLVPDLPYIELISRHPGPGSGHHIILSDGRRFKNGAEAARALGVDKSAVNRAIPKNRKIKGFGVKRVLGVFHKPPTDQDQELDLIPAELDNYSTVLLTKDLVTTYAAHKFAVGEIEGKVKRHVECTISSALVNARSVLAIENKAPKTPRQYYAEHGINLPGCAFEFHGAQKNFHCVPPPYKRPDEELIAGTLRAGRALKETNPNLFLSYTLAYELGLRPGEAVHAKWTWFKQRKNGDVEVTIQADDLKLGEEGWEGPKHSTTERPGRTIAIKREVFNDILPFFNSADPEGYVIPLPTYTARRELNQIGLNGFMRGLGWTKENGFIKASYELRKLRGSDYYAKLGAEQAKNFLGHASVVTTEKFYAALGKGRVKALEPERLPDPLEETSLDSNLFTQVA